MLNKERLNRFLHKFGFEVHGLGYMQSLKKNSFKEDAFRVQQEILGDTVKVIFDVGANRGNTVMEYRGLFPGATIFAFEPFADTYDHLSQKMKGMKNIFCIQSAISDTVGTKTLFVNNNIDTNSLLPSISSGLSSDKQVITRGKVEVLTETIDEFCKTRNIRQVDILKLDIQGGELAALKGAQELLCNKKIRLIYTESFFKGQYLDQPLFYDIANYLRGFKYHLKDIYDPHYGKGAIAWCDCIFLPDA